MCIIRELPGGSVPGIGGHGHGKRILLSEPDQCRHRRLQLRLIHGIPSVLMERGGGGIFTNKEVELYKQISAIS